MKGFTLRTTIKAAPGEVAAVRAAMEAHQRQRWYPTLCVCGRAWRSGLHLHTVVAEAVLLAYRDRYVDCDTTT